jgi:hypothetical protein
MTLAITFMFAAFSAVLYAFWKNKKSRWWVFLCAVASTFVAQGFLTFLAVLIAILSKTDASTTLLVRESRFAKAGGAIALIIMLGIFGYVQSSKLGYTEHLIAPWLEKLLQKPPEKRQIDGRLAIVAPVDFSPSQSRLKDNEDIPAQMRELMIDDQAWMAKFSDSSVAIERIQYRVKPFLRDALLGMSPPDGHPSPIEWLHSSSDYEAGLITYSYKGNRVMPQKVTAVGIISGDTVWIIVGTGENQEAAKAAGDAVRSFTFQ